MHGEHKQNNSNDFCDFEFKLFFFDFNLFRLNFLCAFIDAHVI